MKKEHFFEAEMIDDMPYIKDVAIINNSGGISTFNGIPYFENRFIHDNSNYFIYTPIELSAEQKLHLEKHLKEFAPV